MRRLLFTSFSLVILSILLVDCSSNIDDKINEDNLKYSRDSLKEITELNIVLNKYNAQSFDKISSLDFTYQYQEVLDTNKRIVIEDFKIIDISKKDSLFYFRIETGFFPKQIIEFNCSPLQFQKFNKLDLTEIYISDKYLILDINSIIKTDIRVTSSGKIEDETSVKTELNLDDSNLFIIQATYIDFLNN